MRTLVPITLVLAAVAAGCSEPIVVLVELRTDYVGQTEVASTRTRLFAGAETEPIRSSDEVLPAGDLTGGIRIAELDDLSPGMYRIEVTLLRPDASIQASRNVRFEASTNRAVTVVVSRDCEGVRCPPAGDPGLSACVEGRCVDPGCTPETPELCTPEIDAGAVRDGGTPGDDGGGSEDGGGMADAGTNEDAGPSCTEIYGTSPGYIFCSMSGSMCRFAVTLGGETCEVMCARSGGTCIGAEDNNFEPCVAVGPASCDAARQDQICICSR